MCHYALLVLEIWSGVLTEIEVIILQSFYSSLEGAVKLKFVSFCSP